MATDITLTWTEEKKESFRRDAVNYSLTELAEMYGIAKNTALCIKRRWNITGHSEEYKKRIHKKISDLSLEGQKRMTEEARKRMFERSAAAIRETVRKERRRVLFDLPQQTKLPISLNIEAARQRAFAKYRMVTRNGYISNGTDKRTLYYNENTRRSANMEERNSKKYRFIFKPAEGFNEADSVYINELRWKNRKAN